MHKKHCGNDFKGLKNILLEGLLLKKKKLLGTTLIFF
jgi:hypothetical protein